MPRTKTPAKTRPSPLPPVAANVDARKALEGE
jgi:hypothetical protein